MTETIKTLRELADDALDTAQGGAAFIKYEGVDGESQAAAYNDLAYDLCDPIVRRDGANPMDLKRG